MHAAPNQEYKRILAIHDLSGFGHTSLMAVIPIMYRLGIRVCALPTAILSANTDYPDPVWLDFSPHMNAFAQHWQELGLRFNAIYSGFLSSPQQAQQVAGIIETLRGEGTLVLVDPVMADHGRLYGCFDESIIPAMKALIKQADIITPNFTEACLLADSSLPTDADNKQTKDWCRTISSLGPRNVIVTSAPSRETDQLEVLYYESLSDTLTIFTYPESDEAHPGAGDCFAAFLLAGAVNGFGFRSSILAAINILSKAIETGIPSGSDPREGIALEKVLHWDLPNYYRY